MAVELTRLAVAGPRYAVAPTEGLDPLAAMIARDPELCAHLGLGAAVVGRPDRAFSFLERSDLVMAVTRRNTAQLAGAVTLSRIDLHSRHAFVATFASESVRGGLFFEAVLISVEMVFQVLALQRLRFDVLSCNEPQFARVARYADLEGVRRDWCFVGGEWCDARLYALSQAGWETSGGPMARRLIRAGSRPGAR